ncbi:MAG: hypothetical protein H8D46_03885 [FCB group bacterium]|nr:hypothetical protein [FCB group bacterium]
MLLKRHIPLIIVIFVGLLTLFGHFINNPGVQEFVDNDSTQWFDIIASFAIFLGALNLLKLQLLKVYKKQRNWQYSILAVIGFFFAIFAGFFFRGSNTVAVSGVDMNNVDQIAGIIAEETGEPIGTVQANLEKNTGQFEINKIFLTKGGAEEFSTKLTPFGDEIVVDQLAWGAHLQAKRGKSGSLFYWMFKNIFTPLSATMFALLAFFVASASYRAFRIRNFEATLLLSAGIILMLGRVPIGQLISPWFILYLVVLGIGAATAPFIRDRRIIFGGVAVGLILVTILGFVYGWDPQHPYLINMLFLPNLQSWIFDVPTTAGTRAIMIGIGLGIVGTSFRIIIGLERSFLGEN